MTDFARKLYLWVNDTSSILGNLHDVQALGFDGLIVCIVKHRPIPVAVPHEPDSLAQLLIDAASIEMPVKSWSYCYPDGTIQQISTTAAIINDHEFDDHVLDCEGEWENIPASSADRFAHNLAEVTDHRPELHLSSFSNPAVHPLPYVDGDGFGFLPHCQSFMPQVYLVGDSDPDVVIERAIAQCPPLAARSLGKQLIATVNHPKMLALVADNAQHFDGANVWVYDGDTGDNVVDIGVRGNEIAWAAAITAYKKAYA